MSAATFLRSNFSVQNLRVFGDATVSDDLFVDDDEVVSGDLSVNGTTSLVGAVTLGASLTASVGDISATAGQVRGATVRSDGQLTVAAGGMSIEGSILQNSGNITVSAGTVGALGYTGGTIDISGNAEFGSNGADTFKVHGTGGSGVQSAFVADPASPGAVYSEAEADAVRDAVVSVLTCLKNHGFMAPA